MVKVPSVFAGVAIKCGALILAFLGSIDSRPWARDDSFKLHETWKLGLWYRLHIFQNEAVQAPN